MMKTQEIIKALRATQSRSKRVLLDEAADRLDVWRAYQKNILQTEELLHEINKEQRKPQPDKDKLLFFCLRALEELTETKFLKVREE